MDNRPHCNTCGFYFDIDTESYYDSNGHLRHNGMCMDDKNYLLKGMKVD